MTETKQKTPVTFRSGVLALRLTVKPAYRKVNERGDSEIIPGKAIQFRSGVYTTTDKDEIKFLREHRLHDAIGQSGSFVEVGKEPGRPLPETGDLLAAVAEAAVKKDADKLAEIIVNERNTHSREEVLKSATAALVALEEDPPKPDPVPDHEKPREPYATKRMTKKQVEERAKAEAKTQQNPSPAGGANTQDVERGAASAGPAGRE